MSGDIADASIREAAESLVAARTAWKQEWTVAVELVSGCCCCAMGIQSGPYGLNCWLMNVGRADGNFLELLLPTPVCSAHMCWGVLLVFSW